MANLVDRTYVCSIRNQSQVSDPLNFAGFAAAKFWNVARWTAGRIWNETGRIPKANELQSCLQSHERYRDLRSHSSQRVLQELGEAFNGWYGHRGNGNETANPPGYRKNGGDHPRATVTWKTKGFKFDPNGYVRLSKGPNAKGYWSDYILCAIDAPPTMPDPERIDVRQARAVYDEGQGKWELHLVCKVEKDAPDSPGDGTTGMDLGISNIAAVSFGNETLLYPGGWLKQAKHYYKQIEYECEGENGLSDRARWAKRKLRRKREHFYHVLSKRIICECVERGIGTLRVGDLAGIRAEENGDGRNWGRHNNNKRLHAWAFSQFTSMLEYKAEAEGIEVVVDTERDTSKICSVCGRERKANRRHRGLYKCDRCGFVGNADCNGAENIRTLLPSSRRFDRSDRDNGCLAQPATHLFDATAGRFRPQERVRCKP